MWQQNAHTENTRPNLEWKTDLYTVVALSLSRVLLLNFQPQPQWCVKSSSHKPRTVIHHWSHPEGRVQVSVAIFRSSGGGVPFFSKSLHF